MADALEVALRRDRAVVLAALGLIVGLAAAAMLAGVGTGGSPLDAPSVPGGAMAMAAPGRLALVAMWWLMMIAMMLPSATPTILLAAALNRRARGAPPFAGSAVFVAAYLGVWLTFSIIAAETQFRLAGAQLLDGTMRIGDRTLAAAFLTLAGLWQLAPAKQACLRRCRSPAGFLVGRAGRGVRGAVETGVLHGAYCVGCCWALMALLFVGGVMNLWWILGLAMLAAFEKLAPGGPRMARATGGVLLVAAAALALS